MNRNQILNIVRSVIGKNEYNEITTGKILTLEQIEQSVDKWIEIEEAKAPKRGNSLAIRFKTPDAVSDAVDEEFVIESDAPIEDKRENDHKKAEIKCKLLKHIQYGECLTVRYDYENDKLFLKDK